MDQRLNDALAFANYRLTLQVQRQNILARVEAALLLSYQNSIFRATPELVAFVSAHQQLSSSALYVNDQSDNAVKIDNPQEFAQQLVQTYDAAMALKHQEQQRLKTARNPAKIVGL